MRFSFPTQRGVSNGIIQYLIDNSYTAEASITSSGKFYSNRPASDLLNNSVFYTEKNNSYGQWVLFDFLSFRIDLIGYSINSYDSYEAPSNWRIDVSGSNISWQSIDTKENENTYNPGKMYQVSPINNVRYFRFTQTGESNENCNFVRIDRIDFFGRMNFLYCFKTRRQCSRKNLITFIFVLNFISS